MRMKGGGEEGGGEEKRRGGGAPPCTRPPIPSDLLWHCASCDQAGPTTSSAGPLLGPRELPHPAVATRGSCTGRNHPPKKGSGRGLCVAADGGAARHTEGPQPAAGAAACRRACVSPLHSRRQWHSPPHGAPRGGASAVAARHVRRRDQRLPRVPAAVTAWCPPPLQREDNISRAHALTETRAARQPTAHAPGQSPRPARSRRESASRGAATRPRSPPPHSSLTHAHRRGSGAMRQWTATPLPAGPPPPQTRDQAGTNSPPPRQPTTLAAARGTHDGGAGGPPHAGDPAGREPSFGEGTSSSLSPRLSSSALASAVGGSTLPRSQSW